MRPLAHPVTKPLAVLLGLLPACWLLWAAATDQLGANPAEALIRSLGDWTLRALVLVLLITPLRITAGWPLLARYRRMAGLFVFFYASLHWLAYAWLDMSWVLSDILADVPHRPFILVGTLAWLLLLALALTSFQRAVRAMGGARWQMLHRSVYAVAVLAVLHFYWMRAGKNDFVEVTIYAALLAVLLLWRVWRRYKASWSAPQRAL